MNDATRVLLALLVSLTLVSVAGVATAQTADGRQLADGNESSAASNLTIVSTNDPGAGFDVEISSSSDGSVEELYYYTAESNAFDISPSLTVGSSTLSTSLTEDNKRTTVDKNYTTDANSTTSEFTISDSSSFDERRALIVELSDGSYVQIIDSLGTANLQVETYRDTAADTTLKVSPSNPVTVSESVVAEGNITDADPQDAEFGGIRYTQPDNDTVTFSKQLIDVAPQNSGEYQVELVNTNDEVVASKTVVAESDSGTVVIGDTSSSDIQTTQLAVGLAVLLVGFFAVRRIDL
jgi:hypothetical protein